MEGSIHNGNLEGGCSGNRRKSKNYGTRDVKKWSLRFTQEPVRNHSEPREPDGNARTRARARKRFPIIFSLQPRDAYWQRTRAWRRVRFSVAASVQSDLYRCSYVVNISAASSGPFSAVVLNRVSRPSLR